MCAAWGWVWNQHEHYKLTCQPSFWFYHFSFNIQVTRLYKILGYFISFNLTILVQARVRRDSYFPFTLLTWVVHVSNFKVNPTINANDSYHEHRFSTKYPTILSCLTCHLVLLSLARPHLRFESQAHFVTLVEVKFKINFWHKTSSHRWLYSVVKQLVFNHWRTPFW